MADVAGLGAEGDVVRVADGYARNYLLPRKLAAPLTEAARRSLEKKRRQREVQLAGEKAGAEELLKRIEQVSCTITVKTGAEGKMFGSVTAADVLNALKAKGFELKKHQVDLPEPLRETGVFNVALKLHPAVTGAVKVWIVEE